MGSLLFLFAAHVDPLRFEVTMPLGATIPGVPVVEAGAGLER